MSNNYKAKIALVAALAVLVSAAPGVDKVATPERPEEPATIDLPFLQFKNGGIRVNFAGYHAEAGLGGLLGGPDAKGGLFASAGTPWGPSASAGLGGGLGGQDGTARGGLHARAGLGNGGPEAAAGLGGSLDGSGRSGSRATGRLYAGTNVGRTEASAGLGGTIDDDGVSITKSGTLLGGATEDRKTRADRKGTKKSHIQSIAGSGGGEKVYLAKSGPEEPSTTLEFKLPGADAKKDIVTREINKPIPKNDLIGADGEVQESDVQNIPDGSQASRRSYRKRFRSNPARKQAFYKFLTTNTDVIPDAGESASAGHINGVVARQAYEDHPVVPGPGNYPYGVGPKIRGPTLFDDIFNIPISALAAVNQLLNNKSG